MNFDFRHRAARWWQRGVGDLYRSKLIFSYPIFTLNLFAPIALELYQNLITGQRKALLARNVANQLLTNETLLFPNNEALSLQ